MDIEKLADMMQHEADITAQTLEYFPIDSEMDPFKINDWLRNIQRALFQNLNEKFSEFRWEYPSLYKEALREALEGEREWIEGERKWRSLLLQKYREFLKRDLIINHVKYDEILDERTGIKWKDFCFNLPNGENIKYLVVDKFTYYREETCNHSKEIWNFRSELGEENLNRLENMIFTKEELLEIYNSILNYLNTNGAEFRFSLESIDDLEKKDEEIWEFRSIVDEIIPIPDFSLYGVGNDTCPKFISNYLWTNGYAFPEYEGDYNLWWRWTSVSWRILLKQ